MGAREAHNLEVVDLSKIKVIRKIAHKVIQFLEQLENFQKKLWLKKKFVVETNYCITLDRVPEELYPEIAANDAQREEWVRLFAIDEIEKDLTEPGYSDPLTVDFLKCNSSLIVDTHLFPRLFVEKVLRASDSLDTNINAVLVNGENYQAMTLLLPKLKGQLQCVYADPPYNTDGSPILYKNGFKNSTWISLITDRLAISRRFLGKAGVLCATIDDYQQNELHSAIKSVFGRENIAGTVVIRANPSGRPIPSGFGIAHEYAIFATRAEAATIAKLPRQETQLKRYKEKDEAGRYMWELFRKRGSGSERHDRPTMYYPLYSRGDVIRVPEMEWNDKKKEWMPKEEPLQDEQVHFPIDSSPPIITLKLFDVGIEKSQCRILSSILFWPRKYPETITPIGAWVVTHRYLQFYA